MRTYLICRKKVEIVWWVSDDVSFTRRIERAGGITEPEKASESMTYESWSIRKRVCTVLFLPNVKVNHRPIRKFCECIACTLNKVYLKIGL